MDNILTSKDGLKFLNETLEYYTNMANNAKDEKSKSIWLRDIRETEKEITAYCRIHGIIN